MNRITRADKAAFPDVFYSPHERRRLARQDARPGRRFSVSVQPSRPRGNAFNWTTLIQLVLGNCRGIRRRDFYIELDRANLHLTIVLIGAYESHCADLARAIEPYCPATLVLSVIKHSERYPKVVP